MFFYSEGGAGGASILVALFAALSLPSSLPFASLPPATGKKKKKLQQTYPGAFCTSTEPLAVSSFSVFGRVSSFLSGSFVSVGNSGQVAGTGLTGAAVAPVC